jgi:putative tryptophan/tyrosine transport system substrate-binding protein
MKRREFITLVCGAGAAWPLAAHAQQASKIARVGILGPNRENPLTGSGYQIFLAELRKLGFTEGQNLVVEHRRTDEGLPQAFIAANELVAAKADVLVANGPELSLEAAVATRPAVPVVMLANNFDPIARGYVKSLARPGGNVTGIVSRQPELAAKQLELLVEAFPDRKRCTALWDGFSVDQFTAAEHAAQTMPISLRSLKLENSPYDFETAFRAMAQDETQMVLVLSSPSFTPQRTRIAELAIRHRLPTMFIFKTYVEAGGLMSYGVDAGPMWRRAASYVAKILRGAQPADLPVEQTANFEFAVNLKTAKAMGILLPTSILLRADEVIE